MKKFLCLISAILALFTIFMLSSCDEEGSKITFVVDRNNMDMSVGDIYTVSWSVISDADEPSTISWESSDNAVVACDDGTLHAKGEGRAIVTATHNSGAYQVISITVKNNSKKLYMLEGESLQLEKSAIDIALIGSECYSSDQDVASVIKNDNGALVTANKKGKCDIRLKTENSSIVYYDLFVLSKENSGVNITTDEFPLVVNYDNGRYQSAVRITNISVEKLNTREFLDEKTVQVRITYEIEKIYDSMGDDSTNPTKFIIEVHSPEADKNPIRELEVHTGWTSVASGEVKSFVYTFNVDFELGDGERNYTFTVKEIEEKE